MTMDRVTVQAEFAARRDKMKRAAEKLYAKQLSHGPSRILDIFKHSCDSLFNDDNGSPMEFVGSLKRMPVTIEEFLESKDFIGGVEIEMWPKVKEDIIEICADFLVGKPQVHEYLDMGATGTGKTTKAWIVQAYVCYLWTCIHKPKALYGIADATAVVISMASSNVSTTRDVLFRPFRDLITSMPYFRKYTRWNTERTSSLEFEDGFRIEPVNATTQGIIGRAVVSSVTDEANYMSVIQGSSRAQRGDGRGGVYDQADSFVRAVKLRKKSRFTARIPVIGVTAIMSSARSTDDFMTKRAEEVTRSKEPGVLLFRHKQYEIQPAEKFSKQRFRLLVGTPEYPTRILQDHEVAGEHYPETGKVELVPEDYRYDFMHRPEDAVRDVLGQASVNMSPFITQRHKILEAVERFKAEGFLHPLERDNVDLAEHGYPIIVPSKLSPDTKTKRFAHIDLSRNKDRCGVAVGHVMDWALIPMGSGVYERLPIIAIELATGIKPSKARELDPADVRKWVMALQMEYNIPLYRITYDGFDSRESVMALRRVGIRSSEISLDKNNVGHMLCKRAMYQDRILLPPNELLEREFVQLDEDHTTGKIDHPATGSKDVADAVSGVVTSIMGSRLYRGEVYYCDGQGKRLGEAELRHRALREEKIEAPREDD